MGDIDASKKCLQRTLSNITKQIHHMVRKMYRWRQHTCVHKWVDQVKLRKISEVTALMFNTTLTIDK